MSNALPAALWAAGPMELAPPPFVVEGSLAVPIRLQGLHIELEADAARRDTAGRGTMTFTLPQPGRPLLDLVPDATRLVLDGQEVPADRLRLVLPPDEITPLRMLDVPVDAGAEHTLVIEYAPTDATVSYARGGVQLGFFMTDLDERGYLERHAPAGLEHNPVPMTVDVRITGTAQPHRLFANGTVVDHQDGSWTVTYPAYFTCSSPYLHLSNEEFFVLEGEFAGERTIPVTVYGVSEREAAEAMEKALEVMRELEDQYGAYAHDLLLVHRRDNTRKSMEFAGATATTLNDLGHEIAHSWFARGVMPANGNAGWIDEAIARWRDYDYTPSIRLEPRPAGHLAGFGPYRRHTPNAAYEPGSTLLGELDRVFGGRLRDVLAELYEQKKRQVITTPFFQAFLQARTAHSLDPFFNRYVYGRSNKRDKDAIRALESSLPRPVPLPPAPPFVKRKPHAPRISQLRKML